MATTIKDVAREAGVSITTVSKVLNGNDHDIGRDTRENVLEVVARLHYVRSSSARSLVTKRTNVIGLVIPDISNNYFAELAQAIEVEIRKHGYFLIFCNTSDDDKIESKCLELLQEQSVDGMIIVPTTVSTYEKIVGALRIKKPIVFLDRVFEHPFGGKCNSPDLNLGNIWFDNEKGGYLATNYLIKCGHRKIGCITGPLYNKSAQERLKGYKKALEDNHIPYDENLVVEADYRHASGTPATEKILKKDITAIFIQNDLMAVSAYSAITAAGKEVGKDISIVGYDNTEYCEWVTPKLTSVIQPGLEMGTQAGKMIISLIKGETADNAYQFEPDLCIRQSVAKIAPESVE